MKATIFVVITYGVIAGKSHHYTAEADTAEGCLSLLQQRLRGVVDYTPSLTFRPDDGMIFWGDFSTTAPIGVLYQQGYQ